MTALVKTINTITINEEIQSHPAWVGHLSGLKADKMLRGWKQPYLYILRSGEHETAYETDYYVSYIAADLSVKHTPFVITIELEGWSYEKTTQEIHDQRDRNLNLAREQRKARRARSSSTSLTTGRPRATMPSAGETEAGFAHAEPRQ